jgi:hypothetical protein
VNSYKVGRGPRSTFRFESTRDHARVGYSEVILGPRFLTGEPCDVRPKLSRPRFGLSYNPAYSWQIHFSYRDFPSPTVPSQPCRRPSRAATATIVARRRITTRNRVSSPLNQAPGEFVRKPDKLASRVGGHAQAQLPGNRAIKAPRPSSTRLTAQPTITDSRTARRSASHL